MKKDMDLIREILLKLEVKEDSEEYLYSDEIEGCDELQVYRHMRILKDSGLIYGKDHTTNVGKGYIAESLTSDGYDLLNQIRENTAWGKIKEALRERKLELTIKTIKLVLNK